MNRLYQLIIKPSAEKQLDRLPATIRRRVVAALEDLRHDPRPPGCVKLTGEDDLWRIRVGRRRVRCRTVGRRTQFHDASMGVAVRLDPSAQAGFDKPL